MSVPSRDLDSAIEHLALRHLQESLRRMYSIHTVVVRPPRYLVVDRTASPSDGAHPPGPPLRRWHVSPDSIAEVALGEPRREDAGGAAFAIDRESGRIRVYWETGSTTGSSEELSITSDEDGHPVLGRPVNSGRRPDPA